jgi:hypothetical protein
VPPRPPQYPGAIRVCGVTGTRSPGPTPIDPPMPWSDLWWAEVVAAALPPVGELLDRSRSLVNNEARSSFVTARQSLFETGLGPDV